MEDKFVEPNFKTKGFFGTVVLKEWMTSPCGQNYNLYSGILEVLQDEEILGFKVSSRETNWCVRIEGKKEVLTILGCQIRAIYSHEPRDRYEVNNYIVP